MIIGTGIFASSLALFFYAQHFIHRRDNQPWIARHGQQPGNVNVTVRTDQPKVVTASIRAEPAMIPLPDNDDNRGSEGFLPRVMSFIAGKGLNPDPHVPEKPLNMTQPTQQRVNQAGTHNYTKRLVG